MIRHLRLRRISPAMLQRKLDDHVRVMIVDLQHYEAQDNEVEAIPGAFRADPAKLRAASKLVLPEGIEVVLYCSSQNEFVSARVADAIQKKGVDNVWVLEGGLEAWMLDGRALASVLATAEEAALRVGITLPSELHQATQSHH